MAENKKISCSDCVLKGGDCLMLDDVFWQCPVNHKTKKEVKGEKSV